MKSHVDKKKYADGNKRIPTPIERQNMYADKIANEVYDQLDIGGLTTTQFRTFGQFVIKIKNTLLRNTGETK